MRCWQVGLKTAIAPQGTSITDGQLGLLRRYHAQVECFFDSDLAGQKLERVLTNDPATGVIRHADAGYELASAVAVQRGVRIPMAEG